MVASIIFALFLLSCSPPAPPPTSLHPPLLSHVIYGKDNRREPLQVPSYWRNKARSVAAQIHRQYLSPQNDDLYQLIPDENWDSPTPYCRDEKFYGQPILSDCSGFLIAPDRILTAAHCLPRCPHFVWVFDYRMDKTPLSIPKENVYTCSHSETFYPLASFGEGFGLVHLDRPVPPSRQPLPLRQSGSIQDHERVVLIGYPMGLPLKIDSGYHHTGNTLQENTHPSYFTANLDIYTGNSGSPVFNAQSGLVEGIAIGGEDDFTHNPQKNCYQSKQCLPDTCRGEGVLRITSLLHESADKTSSP